MQVNKVNLIQTHKKLSQKVIGSRVVDDSVDKW